MVRAIFSGNKTQTRRLMRPQPTGYPNKFWPEEDRWQLACSKAKTMLDIQEATNCCPYGYKGDRLWVKETWALWNTDERKTLEGPLSALNLRRYGGGPPMNPSDIRCDSGQDVLCDY